MANDNSPYNQTDYSSERLYTVGSTVTCPPLSPDEESRHVNLDARTIMDNRATDLRFGGTSLYNKHPCRLSYFA